MAARLAGWLDERVGWRRVWEAIFLRKVPKVNWLYTLGSATLFVAVNQIVTGILLTVYYVPTPDHAYDSVQYITTQVTAGWLIRGLHHWGASAMVILTALHLLRVLAYGAYKYPARGDLVHGRRPAAGGPGLWVHRVPVALGSESLLGHDRGHPNRRRGPRAR